MNWWHEDRPSSLSTLMVILCSKDESKIPVLLGIFKSIDNKFKRELETNLPVKRPYWIRNRKEFGKDGIRPTWIGHATALFEIDGAVILTDPIFRFLEFLKWY